MIKHMVSTHAPRVGSDTRRCSIVPQDAVSTHAPRVGSDQAFMKNRTQPNSFNSRSPSGERRYFHYLVERPFQFQLTLPEWGATTFYLLRLRRFPVSTHAPRVGSDDRKHVNRHRRACFNSRSPSGERRASRTF